MLLVFNQRSMFCAFPLVQIPKLSVNQEWTHEFPLWALKDLDIMQLLDEVEHNIMNYQCWGLSNIWLGWGK